MSDSRGALLGAAYVEASNRFPIARIIPMDIGLGPAIHPTGTELGAQLTVRLPTIAVRARYRIHDGFEIWFGYQIPIPLLFERSR